MEAVAVESAVELRDVSKQYGTGPAVVVALDAIHFSVARGELVAIMGPSGSGKSTLLTIAGTLEQPTTGEVFIDGVDVLGMSSNDRARLRRRQIGFVFQDFNLLPGLTATENVALPLELDGMPPREAKATGLKALEPLGLADRGDHYPDELSGGEGQRVALARALVGDRDVLLCDEPTGALDSANGDAVLRILRTACDGGAAGVVVTHEEEVAAWADRVVTIRDGRMVAEVTPVGAESTITPGSWA